MSDGHLTPGDPLGAGREADRHESGLPLPPREGARAAGQERAPAAERERTRDLPLGDTPPPPAPATTGYRSPPPPGAGGSAPQPMVAGRGDLVLAGWWRRAGAAIIDFMIIGAVALAVMAPLGIGAFAVGDDDAGFFALIAAFFVAALVVTVVAFLYAPFLMARTNGQTLGRMATGIRVVRTSGEPMTFGWAMLREVAVKGLLIGTVANSVTFGLASLLDVLWPLWDEENRALHDYVSQTRTVLS